VPRREDWKLLKILSKCEDKSYYNSYIAKPHIILPDYRKVEEWAKDKRIQDLSCADVLNLLPFDSFSASLKSLTADLSDFEEHYLYTFFDRSEVENLSDKYLPSRIISTNYMYRVQTERDDVCVASFDMNVRNFVEAGVDTFFSAETGDVSNAGDHLGNFISTAKELPKDRTLDWQGVDMEKVQRDKAYIITAVINSLWYLAEQDLVPVEVTPKSSEVNHNKHNSKKKPWMREDFSRVIFLNRLPAERDDSVIEHTGRSVKGHPRRGHWHRLMHERFKNHPKYKSRIRIRPTWVGPKNTEYRGAIYKLIEPANPDPEATK